MAAFTRGAKKALADIDARIERVYRQRCAGVQISVLDIGKVFKVGRQAVAAGADDAALGDTIAELINGIRKN